MMKPWQLTMRFRLMNFRARFFDLFVAMCNHVDDIVDMLVF